LTRLRSSTNLNRLFAALRQKQFRYFLAGSFLSNIGSWMQSLAMAWLILDLTHSPFYLGLEGFANTFPITIFSFYGGIVADRLDRRRLLIGTQWVMLVLAAALGVLTQIHRIQIWHIISLAFIAGLSQSIAWPVYQTVMANIAERQHLSNAIALNSAQFNMARTIGPVVGALGLRYFGTAGCFYANAVSFLAVIIALEAIRIPINRHTPETEKQDFLKTFHEGFTYMFAQKHLFWLLVMIACTSIFGVPLVTLLPAFAREILHMDPSGLGTLMASFGAGAVLGGFGVAYLGEFAGKERFAVRGEIVFVIAIIAFALVRNPLLCMIFLFLAGCSMVSFASVVNSLVQSQVPEHMRGRAMSLFVFAFGGCMPFGNLLAGWFAHVWGVPLALLVQGTALGIVVGYISWAKFAKLEPR
jgi:MFS family permease